MKNIFRLIILLIPFSSLHAQDVSNTRLSKTSLYNFNAAKPKPDMEFYYYYDDKATTIKGVDCINEGFGE